MHARSGVITFAAGAVVVLASCIAAHAAEIKVTSSNGVKTVLEQLAPAFQKETGHKLVFTWGAAALLKGQIEKGAVFDVTVLTAEGIDDLIAKKKLAADTRAALANSYVGVAVRKGAPKPDIGTVEAFKHALLAANSIAYVEQGGTGIYLRGLLPRLGIADAVKGKVKLLPPENPAAHAVSNGEAEIGMTQISEILPYPGADLVGPLPAEIQLTTSFVAAVASASAQMDAAKSFIRFVTSPNTAEVYKAKGLAPSQ